MDDPLVETWLIHDRINRYLLDAVPDDAMGVALPKCRTVSDLFAHVHNVKRLDLRKMVESAIIPEIHRNFRGPSHANRLQLRTL